MENSYNLLLKIETLRNVMHNLIDERQDLLNSQIIRISQEIDVLLNQLHQIREQGKN